MHPVGKMKSLKVIKEVVNVQRETIELWMHLGGLQRFAKHSRN